MSITSKYGNELVESECASLAVNCSADVSDLCWFVSDEAGAAWSKGDSTVGSG